MPGTGAKARQTPREAIPNVLADRYASTPMVNLWGPSNRVILERDFWITVMQGERDLGVNISQAALDAYKKVKGIVDFEAIREKEKTERHDVNARVAVFNELAGFGEAHRALTSRDQTDNVEQMQVKAGLIIVRDKTAAALSRMADLAVQYDDTVMAGRTHLVPAQPTTLGKRFSNYGEELLRAFDGVEQLIHTYPLRGLKGAVGTQTDLLQLLKSPEKVDELERIVANHLGFEQVMGSVGQVYPRSLDFETVSTLLQLASGPANLAIAIRLMAGQELASEGFKKGQVGSSAMPHKMNARSCERIAGLAAVLRGHTAMAASLTGDQWLEGDVHDSVTRRVLLPDAFFAVDGLFETFLTVLDEMGIYPAAIKQELELHLPFLTTTRVLTAAMLNGALRETAHEAIKEHATEAVLQRRTEGTQTDDLFERFAKDVRIGLTREQLAEIIADPSEFTGRASEQVVSFAARVAEVVKKYPEAAGYVPEEIL